MDSSEHGPFGDFYRPASASAVTRILTWLKGHIPGRTVFPDQPSHQSVFS